MRRILVILLLAGCFSVSFSDVLTATRGQNQPSEEALTNQEPLTNSDILRMVRSKTPVEKIIDKIKTSRCHFDTTPTVLAELEYKRVPPAVLVAMSEAPFGAPTQPTVEVPRAEIVRKDVGQARSDPPPAADKTEHVERTSSPLLQATEVSGAEHTVDVTSLTEDLQDEIALGYSRRGTLLSQYPAVRGTKEDHLAQTVFAKLKATSVFQKAPTLPYSVTIIERNDLNAFTTMGGHLYVTLALARLLGDNTGMWAAVEGHEMGHNIGRHGYKSYVRESQLERQIAYYRYRAALGDQSANWTLITLQIAGGLLNKKMNRDAENEADKLGLGMMVEAGYHPDFAITLYRKLKAREGDPSKFAALFSDHPRWTTREERALKLYDEALVRFESRWPDAASSPGGVPPTIATFGKISFKQDKQEKSVVIHIPYRIRNARNVEVDTEVLFYFKGNAVPSLNPQFKAGDGSLVANRRFTPLSGNESGSVDLTVPTTAIGIKERKLKAKVCLSSQGESAECSKEMEASFPKN